MEGNGDRDGAMQESGMALGSVLSAQCFVFKSLLPLLGCPPSPTYLGNPPCQLVPALAIQELL